jgi:hypothetical protein
VQGTKIDFVVSKNQISIIQIILEKLKEGTNYIMQSLLKFFSFDKT